MIVEVERIVTWSEFVKCRQRTRAHVPTAALPQSSISHANKPKHYSYCVDHDLGFAPHISGRVCTVCGCKSTTIEKWATAGSWVIGIGARGTGKPNMLIYAMQVTTTPSYKELRASRPSAAAYLRRHRIAGNARVLLSDRFYYFGDNAQTIPQSLTHIIQPAQGCRRLSAQDIENIHSLILNRFDIGRHGEPNNAPGRPSCARSEC
jgi:hypothetical protein